MSFVTRYALGREQKWDLVLVSSRFHCFWPPLSLVREVTIHLQVPTGTAMSTQAKREDSVLCFVPGGSRGIPCSVADVVIL